MTFLLIISILLLLLITSTPISIALGMTVLVFLLGFSSFSIRHRQHHLAAPVHRPGKLRHHGGAVLRAVRPVSDRRQDRLAHHPFRQQPGGLDAGRHGDGRGAGVRLLCHDLRLQSGHGDGDRLGDAARHGEGGLSEALRRRRDRHCRFAGHPDPAFHRDDHLCGCHQRERRQAVHRRHRAGHPACAHHDGRWCSSRPNGMASRPSPSLRPRNSGIHSRMPGGDCSSW